MRRICTFLIQKIKCLIVFIVHFDTLLGFPVFSFVISFILLFMKCGKCLYLNMRTLSALNTLIPC